LLNYLAVKSCPLNSYSIEKDSIHAGYKPIKKVRVTLLSWDCL